MEHINSSSPTLVGRNLRWFLLLASLVLGFLPGGLMLLGGLTKGLGDSDGLVLLLISLFYLTIFGLLPLWQIPWRHSLALDVSRREIVLTREYLVGRKRRERRFSVDQITEVKVQKGGINFALVIRDAKRKSHQVVFPLRQYAQAEALLKMLYQSKGLPPERAAEQAANVLPPHKPLASPETLRAYLRRQGKALVWVAVLNLVVGAFGLLVDGVNVLNGVNVASGMVYLIAGWGVLQEKRWAGWLGLLTLIAERSWIYFYARLNQVSPSPVAWIVFVVMLFLWFSVIGILNDLQAQEIRQS